MKVIGNLTKDAIIRAAVSESQNVSSAVDSTAVFLDADISYSKVIFDSSNNKFVVAFKRISDSKGCAVVGTVSGTSISYGSVVEFEQGNTQYISGAFDSNSNKVVITYRDYNDSIHGKAIVGTVSGTSISFGTAVTFNAAETEEIFTTFDSNSNKVVTGYRNVGDNRHGYAIVGTVSGTSISFGSAVEFENARVSGEGITFDSNSNKVVITYRDHGNSNYGTAIIGTVSGTSISFGTPVVYHSSSSQYNTPAFDTSSNKVLVAFRDGAQSDIGHAIVGTVSGTSISFGTVAEFETNATTYISNVFDSNANKFVIGYQDGGDSNYGTLIEATVSGTSVTFGSSVRANASAVGVNTSLAFDSNSKKVLFTYRDETNSKGRSVLYQVGYTSATGGTIADGKAVIVNANGTVSTISQTAASLGSIVAANSATSGQTCTVFDSSNNKHVVVYRSSSVMKYAVATVASDGSVSFASANTTVESSDNQQIAGVFDSTNNRVIFAYRRGADSDHGYAIVGSLSGNTVTWGSATEFNNASNTGIGLSFDTTAGKGVVSYKNGGNSNYGTARVFTVSGTSISFGTAVVFNSGSTDKTRPVYDSTNDKTVISFADDGDSSKGKAVVGTISGTDISFGSEVQYEQGQISHSGIAFDSDTGKVVIAYRQNASSGGSTDFKRGTAVVGTVSGTTISFGTPVAFDNTGDYGENTPNSVIYDSNAKKVLVVYPRTVDGSYSNRGFVFPLSVSGTTVVADTPTNFNGSATAGYPAISFDTNVNKSLIAFYHDSTEYASGVSFAPLSGNLTTENFVGFMKGAALDGTNGEILSSCSIARNQTSLTPGQTYFVSPTDGALSLTAGSPSVTAGTAISNTELIVKG